MACFRLQPALPCLHMFWQPLDTRKESNCKHKVFWKIFRAPCVRLVICKSPWLMILPLWLLFSLFSYWEKHDLWTGLFVQSPKFLPSSLSFLCLLKHSKSFLIPENIGLSIQWFLEQIWNNLLNKTCTERPHKNWVWKHIWGLPCIVATR